MGNQTTSAGGDYFPLPLCQTGSQIRHLNPYKIVTPPFFLTQIVLRRAKFEVLVRSYNYHFAYILYM